MTFFLKRFCNELIRHVKNLPSFAPKKSAYPEIQTSQMDQINRQIEEVIQRDPERLIVLLGPIGCGKTTQTNYFFQKYPKYHYRYKSLVKMDKLDLAFLHLLNFFGHFFFILLFFSLAVFFMWQFPVLAPLPILLILGYFLIKNPGTLVYITHEAIDTLFTCKDRIIILDDFERSSLSSSDQWALLANLWKYKRIYLILLGYSPLEKQAKLKIMEQVMKLEGIIIEIPLDKDLNLRLIQQRKVPLPFDIDSLSQPENNWIALFTPREILMIGQQLALLIKTEKSSEEFQQKCVQIWFDFLLINLGIDSKNILLDLKKNEIQGLSMENLSSQQKLYLKSFIDSMSPKHLEK